jgi:hypothetical protein
MAGLLYLRLFSAPLTGGHLDDFPPSLSTSVRVRYHAALKQKVSQGEQNVPTEFMKRVCTAGKVPGSAQAGWRQKPVPPTHLGKKQGSAEP